MHRMERLVLLLLLATGVAARRQTAAFSGEFGTDGSRQPSRVTWPDYLRDLQAPVPNFFLWEDEPQSEDDASSEGAAPLAAADVGDSGKPGVRWRDEAQTAAGLKDVQEQGPGMDYLAWGKVPSDVYQQAMAKMSAHGHVLCESASASSRDATGFFAEHREEFKKDLLTGLKRYMRQRGRETEIMDAIDGIVVELVEHKLGWAKSCTIVEMPLYTQALKHGLDLFNSHHVSVQAIVHRQAFLRMMGYRSAMRKPASAKSMHVAALHCVDKWMGQVTLAVTKHLGDLLQLGDGPIILDSALAKLIEEAVVKRMAEWVTSREKQDVSGKLTDDFMARHSEDQRLALEQLRKVVEEKGQQLAETNSAP